MAAGSVVFYNTGIKAAIVDGDWSVDAKALALATSGYTPALTHSTWADVSANEVAGGGDYSPKVLANPTDNHSGGVTTLDADDVSFGASVTITAKYAVCVLGDTTLAGTDELVFYVDLNSGGGSVSSSSGPFDVNWNASGIATVAAA
jgi:hypothetical protein